MIKAVLFDLDGTLLSMDQDHFISEYLKALAAHLAPRGYDPTEFSKAIWKGTGAMIKNDGSRLNEKVFWEVFSALFPNRDISADLPYFDEFYEKKFDSVRDIVSHIDPDAIRAVAHIKKKGLRTILATNPLFPSVATEKRIRWAGFEPCDFELFTSYENSSYSKPNLDYYREILEKTSLSPSDCLMVGNDVSDDMVTKELGMKVFLLTDHLLNREGADISVYPRGSFSDLIDYVDTLI